MILLRANFYPTFSLLGKKDELRASYPNVVCVRALFIHYLYIPPLIQVCVLM